MSDLEPVFKRILLKLSGEALTGDGAYGIDPKALKRIVSEISSVHELGVQIAIVVGGGNIFRGLQSKEYGIGNISGDHMGMLATILNSIALGAALENIGLRARVMTAIDMNKIAEPYLSEKAYKYLLKNHIVIVGGGTGNPFFTTDTAATLRALELGTDVLLKATRVDGIYDADPEQESSARHFPQLTYSDIIEKRLKVMDLTAVSLAMDSGLPIIVFNLGIEGNLKKAVIGEKTGTLVKREKS
jgi:uridylate kinase